MGIRRKKPRKRTKCKRIEISNDGKDLQREGERIKEISNIIMWFTRKSK